MVFGDKYSDWQRQRRSRVLRVIVLATSTAIAGFYLSPQITLAQDITPDGTAIGSLVNLSGATYTIEGGTQVGSNLLHSFSQFSVPEGYAADFKSGSGIANIISRVTVRSPANVSYLNGTLKTDGPSLFLLNPNGIIIGPHASLKIGGSFIATTADAIRLRNGDTFSSDPSQPLPNQLLNVDPSALLFNQIVAAPLRINPPSVVSETSTDLTVNAGKSLLLVGGAVSVTNAILNAPQGSVELGGLASTGTIGLILADQMYHLNLTDGSPRADISLDNTQIDVNGTGSGAIAIIGRQLEITNGTRLDATSETQDGKDIIINASETASIADSFILSDTTDLGQAGNVQVIAGQTLTINSTFMSTQTSGGGNAGRLSLSAGETIRIGQASYFDISTTGTGNSGDTLIEGKQGISIQGETAFFSDTSGSGNAGNINLKSAGAIVFDNSNLFGYSSGTGKGGNISLRSQSLSLENGARFEVTAFDVGSAGNIEITTHDFIDIAGFQSKTGGSSGFFSSTSGVGKAGQIRIETGTLRVREGAVIGALIQPAILGILTDSSLPIPTGEGGDIVVAANTVQIAEGGQILTTARLGSGNAGNIAVNAAQGILLTGSDPNYSLRESLAQSLGIPLDSISPTSGLFANTEAGSTGQGGNLELQTGTLTILDGAGIGINSDGSGKAGELLRIQAQKQITINNGFIDSSVGRFAEGNGGAIQVQARSLFLNNRARIAASTAGSGNAGNINLQVDEQVILVGTGTGIFASTSLGSTGNGGSIFVDPHQVILRDGARISVDSQGAGLGGNISIMSNQLLLDNQAAISAETASNQGGNIRLQVRELLQLRRNSSISTTAGTAQAGGNGGNIDVTARFVFAIPTENSDITANAFQGNGGRVTITAEGIFGLQFRNFLTPASDITASSAFGSRGIVDLNILNVNPSQGLVALPTELQDSSGLMAQSCSPNGNQRNGSFTVTGKGGLPPNPTDPIISEGSLATWVTLATATNTSRGDAGLSGTSKLSSRDRPLSPSPLPPVAQGWVKHRNGEVTLVTATPSAPQAIAPTPTCGLNISDRSSGDG